MKEKTFTIKRDEFKEIILDKPGHYVVNLVEQGATAVVRAAFNVSKKEQVDFSVIIHHQAPNTEAQTMMRGVAGDSAKIKFLGRIIIDPDCGNSSSFLTERVLLLSDQASAECIPDLEIHTDDVRCSHAASISRIPEEQIFYLTSRGMDRKTAKEMIVDGFLTLDN